MMLIIDNYDSFTYNLYQEIAAFYDNIKVVRNDQITVSQVNALKPSGVILSPGPGRPENAGICRELILTLLPTIPLLGVCLGLQAIVIAFGGKIIGAPQIVHGKHDLIFHTGENIYRRMSQPFQAGRYHSLMADPDTLPDCLSIDAKNAPGLIMGLRHKTRPIFGVQFHPESILTPLGKNLLQDFVQHCVAAERLPC